MIYLEMSRDEAHGGGTWGFSICVWSPAKKRDGSDWPFWSKVLQVREGDTVLHLRGIKPNADFVGYSIASGDGFETNRRPPDPGQWNYSKSFYRADLSGFTPFHKPVNLEGLFSSRRTELETYFDENRTRGVGKSNLFYVKQAGRLQCLNGAYLSDVDGDLLTALFGSGHAISVAASGSIIMSVETASQIATVRSRLGQAKFARAVKNLYNNRCCFPGCPVSDPRFLVASHIARWSDNEQLRGDLGNGLCLCLLHDKAFELGMFTLDETFKVFINPKERATDFPVVQELIRHHGHQISMAEVHPLDEALLEHWIRVDIEP